MGVGGAEVLPERGRRRRECLGRCTATGAGVGAVEVPLARWAVIHRAADYVPGARSGDVIIVGAL
ncbi:hypothetical protein C0036_12100 [Streptomyces sp. DJ]|nr:hypothetical protein C0036_12100 [Streptomyces sp. DJ]